jgi:hypothetical protein
MELDACFASFGTSSTRKLGIHRVHLDRDNAETAQDGII